MTPRNRPSEDGSRITVRVQPRAAKNEIVGWRDGILWVRLTAPPVEGAANRALTDFIAETLRVRRGDVALVAGEKSRNKIVEVAGLTAEDVKTRLGPR